MSRILVAMPSHQSGHRDTDFFLRGESSEIEQILTSVSNWFGGYCCFCSKWDLLPKSENMRTK